MRKIPQMNFLQFGRLRLSFEANVIADIAKVKEKHKNRAIARRKFKRK